MWHRLPSCKRVKWKCGKNKYGETRILLKHQKSYWINQFKIQNTQKNEDHERHSEIPEWLQEFKENLVDCRVLESRDSHWSSSHGLSIEFARSTDLVKKILILTSRHRNYKIFETSKIARHLCRRRIDGAAPPAENFHDLSTADHYALSQWRLWISNNHRFSVVIEDLIIRWIQSYPYKKNFSGNTKELVKGLGVEKEVKSHYNW